ncbi:oligosaccharide flippase family protein [Myroides sp. JBRI-B21084]|uniref:oligosaccharide flippase family protein n=1 Tax=Myroides sp. JBRI-B21084 TaxID=3119977 RepID=UPI0026E21C96|nr:oligosaccharide flippase family protein [Paenimyroides cloacae]WKW45881.1 oligosaccharide flippase family protein [Paenimyroides cloacae]
MSVYKSLFKSTLVYGIAAVVPKMIGFIMVPYHIKWMNNENVYGSYSVLFTWIMIMNALLSFGMETAFFRFYNKLDDKEKVKNNALWFILAITAVFTLFTLGFKTQIAQLMDKDPLIIAIIIGILALDALVVIPFAILRAHQQSKKYTILKLINVVVNALLTVFFLYSIPMFINNNPTTSISHYFSLNFQVGYVYLANLIASLVTFLMLFKWYKGLKFTYDWKLNKEMIKYAFPVMIASLAFAINEGIDRVMIEEILPKGIGEAEAGRYSACYKIGIFMILFRMAYSLGIEPFFFNYAKNSDAQEKYATITKYFVIFGSCAMLVIIVFADLLKPFLISKKEYWTAMEIVPYIVLANFMLGIYTNLSVWYKLRDKTHIGALISIAAACLTISLNYILIPAVGIVGAAATSMIAYLVMMVASYFIGQKYYPIPYNTKAISMYLGISVLFSFGYFYNFRENYFIGIAFILIFVGLIYYNEKTVINRLLKSIQKK